MNNPAIITKKELRNRLDLTANQLYRLLNVDYIDILEKLSYKKRQKYMLKHQLDAIFPAGIDNEK
jgi:hypothetical protein